MISKHFLPVIAIIMVCMFILPGYVQAAEYVDKTIDMEIDSENQDQYDEVVNLADPSTAITNPDTWNPSPRGIWMGASTEESLFSLNDILYENNTVDLFHEVKFNSTQIMNGASVTVIRSPVSMNGVELFEFSLYRLLNDTEWNIHSIIPAVDGPGVHSITGSVEYVASFDINILDTSITGGEDTWVLNDRCYVELHAPIYSGVNYILHWRATYAADARPAIYLSSQDVANDGINRTRWALCNEVSPDNIAVKNYSWAIEAGVSFDMINGLGNSLYAESVYVHAGDYLTWETSDPDYPDDETDYYHTLMMPFVTDDHTLNATVTYTKATTTETVVWQDSNTEWLDYILACSESPVAFGTGGRYTRVNITFNEDVRVNFMFIDTLDYYLDDMATFTLSGITHNIYARPWASYQLSLGDIVPPSVNPYDWPGLLEVQENQKQTWYGTIIGIALVIVGAAVIATGIGIPIGVAMVAGGLSLMIIEDIAHRSGYSGLPDYVGGLFQNAIDAIWDALQGVGEFLRSVGEGIWDAITWFVDAVIEYGSILLGLLIIAVALMLFFYPIKWQLGFWDMVWAMASGDWKGAAKAANGLDRDISKAMRTAGKVDKRISRAEKVLSKKYTAWEKSRNDRGGEA